MNKIKKLFKNRIFLCLFTALLAGSITVKAATYFPSNDVIYDNSESGLSSTDVQGAIDELYNTCKNPPLPPGGEGILESVKIVTSGDGLYKDEYETEYNDKYVYKGKNPNNYIYFNNELWRIISIEGNRTIKIIRNETIGYKRWDNYSDNWSRPSDLNTYLNGTYYNGLTSTAQKQIIIGDFAIGDITYSDSLSNQINDENREKWSGKIALPTISEYIRANSYKSQCGTTELIFGNRGLCTNTNWMYMSNTEWWTLTPIYLGDQNVFIVTELGDVSGYDVYSQYQIRPTLYLSSDTQITGGTGTQNDPYQIK